MANLNQLQRTTARPYRRVGRGQGSRRGKTSGRGGKGQTARAGHKIRPELRDIIKKLPKRRGYGKNRARTVYTLRPKPFAVTLWQLEQAFESGNEITLAALREKKLVKARGSSAVKVIGNDALTKKFTIRGLTLSASARAAIEKAGGSVAK